MASEDIPIHIYVIHYTELKERKDCVESLVRFADPVHKVKVDVITNNDPNKINMAGVRSMLDVNAYPEDHNQTYAQFVRPLSMNILSNNLKHFEAISMAAKGGANEYHLILEDDVVFSSNVVLQVRSMIRNLESQASWDVIMLGQPSSSMATGNNADLIPLGKNNVLPCCESYVLSTRSAKMLVEKMLPFRFSMNVQLSYLFDRFDVNAFKVFPNIVGDGSKMGTYVSTVQPNNVLIFNNTFKEMYTILSKEKEYVSPADIEHVQRLLANNEFKQNPDIMHLEGLLYKSKGQYPEAMKVFEKALEIYNANHAIINNNSIFLRNYIDCFKKAQTFPKKIDI